MRLQSPINQSLEYFHGECFSAVWVLDETIAVNVNGARALGLTDPRKERRRSLPANPMVTEPDNATGNVDCAVFFMKYLS